MTALALLSTGHQVLLSTGHQGLFAASHKEENYDNF